MASLADALAYQAKRSQYVDDMTAHPSDLEKAVQDQFGMQPNMDRGALLPYKSKDKGWVAPEVAYQLAKLLASPSVAMHGGNISPQEAIESANTLSGFMTPAGLLSKPSPAMARMNVYHGSPHKFDAFDASKIGTGEGAQAYGHGLYLAENPKVAQEYADALGKEVLLKGKPAYQAKTGAVAADLPVSSGAAGHLRMNDWDLQKALKTAEDDFVETGDQWFAKVHKELSTLNPSDIQVNRGQMYKVDLPDEMIARMLDWDKPLSQQPKEAQQPLRDMWIKAKKSFSGIDPNADPTASQIHHLYQQHRGGNSAAVADELRNAGIPGIRYLDEGSRNMTPPTVKPNNGKFEVYWGNDPRPVDTFKTREAAEAAAREIDGRSRNFVVFPGEEHNLKILKRE